MGSGDQRFLYGVFCGGEICVTACHGAEHLRREVAQQGPDACLGRRDRQTSGGPLITCRTSIGMMSGVPPGPGADDAFAAIS